MITSEYLPATSTRSLYTEDNNYILEEDVHVYIRQNEDMEGEEKTLTFRFYDDNYVPINPAEFDKTDWDKMAEGLFFNKEQTSTYVRYNVAYPLPLLELPMSYTNKEGNKVHLSFTASRLSTSGYRINRIFSLTLLFIQKDIGRSSLFSQPENHCWVILRVLIIKDNSNEKAI